MLGIHVASDIDLEHCSDSVSFQTSWGPSVFHTQLLKPTSDQKEIKRRQLPLMALKTESTARSNIQTELKSIKTNIIDDVLQPTDARITESLHQIFWESKSFGSFLNKSPVVLNALCIWKTILLPLFAVLMPILAVIVPFFTLQYFNSTPLTMSSYLEHVKEILLQQISIPAILKSRHKDDRFGFLLESFFIGLTVVMFVSSLWNQISAALHLRTIWFDIEARGQSILHLRSTAKTILESLKSLPLKKQKALRSVIQQGDNAIDATDFMDSLDPVTIYGSAIESANSIQMLKTWIGTVDCLVSIASLPAICFPTVQTSIGLNLVNVYHPAVKHCISNNCSMRSSLHSIVTGPNRGGKSTYCKSVVLAVVTAQSWGFAWAESMTLSPFDSIVTALEPRGTLGKMSTFETEIEFAKDVLHLQGSAFVVMDEIFHSTNAGDGVAASTVFLKQLYERPTIVSIISTHYKDLVPVFSKQATPLQLVSTEDEKGDLSYTYKVEAGVSDKSSVMEILKERGLLSTTVANPVDAVVPRDKDEA
jgi:hypothetical protein